MAGVATVAIGATVAQVSTVHTATFTVGRDVSKLT
jgi:hypothetical protein